MHIYIKHTKNNWLVRIQNVQYSEIPKSLTKTLQCAAEHEDSAKINIYLYIYIYMNKILSATPLE